MHVRARLVFALATAVFTEAACQKTDPPPEDDACSESAALSASPFSGHDLPPKTLALTFDDGPGARTPELSHFLAANGIHAAFFVNGKMMWSGTDVLAQLVADGHVIGNHTQNHPNLTWLSWNDVNHEVEMTDALIAPFVADGRFLFRPPYGAFDRSCLDALTSSAMVKYVGPVDWSIGGTMGSEQASDWDCWSPDGTSNPPVLDVKTCGDRYLDEIRKKSSGIVLMHDPYFIDGDPTKGGTVDMVEYLVPILVAEGYQFIRVDEVPEIAAALPPSSTPLPPPGPPPSPSSSGEESAATTAAAFGDSQIPGGSAAGSRSPAGSSGGTREPCPRSPQSLWSKSRIARATGGT
jgi:peptidoglycan-N-acetylglucosamine deacetylase